MPSVNPIPDFPARVIEELKQGTHLGSAVYEDANTGHSDGCDREQVLGKLTLGSTLRVSLTVGRNAAWCEPSTYLILIYFSIIYFVIYPWKDKKQNAQLPRLEKPSVA